MASLIPGYEYDIFISYRQKDNKYDGWVTEFVDNLKRELEATFKEEVSVYFDINPHDGLLETHDVDASLKEKLKCLVFIPIISRTYCDPKSFAWEHEFIAFIEEASKDQFGLKVKLPNGNVANRLLPVRIHDLDANDIQLCESVLGGVLRGVEFIYKEPGVNRSLTAKDKEKKNLNGTIYRNQLNKVALAIKEIILGLQSGPSGSVKNGVQQTELFGEPDKGKKLTDKKKPTGLKKRWVLLASSFALLIIVTVYVWPKFFKHDSVEKLTASGEKISVAIMPFQNMTNDKTWDIWQEGIQQNLISSFSLIKGLRVRTKDNISDLIKNSGYIENAAISPRLARTISEKLESDIYIFGSIQKAGSTLRIDAQIINTRTKDVLQSFKETRPYNESIIIGLTDSLSRKITDFLLFSKLIKNNPLYQTFQVSTRSPEAMRCYIYGNNAKLSGDISSARKWYLQALTIDSSFLDAKVAVLYSGTDEEQLKGIIELYSKKDKFPLNTQIWINRMYSGWFESIDEQIKWTEKIQENEDQSPGSYWDLGGLYSQAKLYDKAIATFKIYLEKCQKVGLNDFSPYAALGETYHKMGRYNDEKKLYKKAERDIPDKTQITYRWIVRDQAILSLIEKDTVEANRYISKFLSLLKEESFSEAEIANVLSDIYDKAGVADKAEKYYRKAVSLEPDNPGLLDVFALFLSRNNGKHAEFTSIIDKALKLAHTKWDYYTYLDTKGYGFYKLGMYKEALDILQKLWDETPFKVYFIKSHLEEVKKAVAGQK
jgi:tetratricopeptide (TPR) repeat protein